MPTETPAASATPAPSESPVPSETPAPTETPEATEEPVVMNEEAYETTANVENADITVTVKVPEGALPVDAKLQADLIGEETEEYAEAEAALADEALNEQPVEYDGMIALDIRFELNGEEIEPLFPVEVTIDAKAMLPEDADPETVAVQHLEENEAGEVTAVKTVADATEATGDVTVEATQTEEAAMDMASTFAVDGFSIFTITFRGSNRLNVFVEYKTTSGVTINYEQDLSCNVSESGSTEKMTDIVADNGVETLQVDGTTYTYKETRIDDVVIEGIQRRDGEWKYKVNNNEFRRLRYKTIVLIYNEQIQSESGPLPSDITTVSEAETGIHFELFNYDKNINSLSPSPNDFLFFNSDYGWDDRDSHYNSDLSQGIVSNTLESGYPVLLAPNGESKGSLGYLFGAGDQHSVTPYEADYLLYRTADGYYEYNSADHAADYSEANKRFYVRNYQEYTTGAKDTPTAFLPFNYTANRPDHILSGSETDYWFGMTMSAVFNQPYNGKVNDQNMVFEFSGDDDVWVYIDDVLVLDLGGIHAEVSGTINFATGEVKTTKVDGSDGQGTTIKDQFIKAGKDTAAFKDGTNTFKDYTSHTIKFFYLERGAGGSNCHIKLNLPTIPTNDLAVAKKVTQTGANDAIDADTQFDFVLKNGDAPVVGQAYVIYDLDAYTQDPTDPGEVKGNGTTESDGRFKIKADQVAVFKGIIQAGSTDVYTVSEQLTEALEENISAVYVDGVDSPNRTTTLTATDRYTLFDNWVTDTGEYQLSLTKQWKNQNGSALAAAAIPFTEVHVTVEQYYKTGDGSTTSSVNSQELILTADNGWHANYTKLVENYTAFRVTQEEVYIGEERIVTYQYDQNGEPTVVWGKDEYSTQYSEWEIGDFEFVRDYTAQGTVLKVITPNSSKAIPVPTNGCVIVRNQNDAVIWTPYLEIMSDETKQALLNAIQRSDFDGGWGAATYYFMNDSNLPASLESAKNAIQNLNYQQDIVEVTFSGSNEWNKVAYGGIALASTEISASLTNTLDTTGTVNIPVEKKWVDGEGHEIAAGAEKITVQLLKDDQEVSGTTLTLSDGNNWKGSFQNLAKYNSDGTLIEYTVDEVKVPGYTSAVTGDMQTGFTITNTPSNGKLIIMKEIKNDAGQNVAGFGGGKDVFSFKITDTDGKTWYMHVNGAGTAVVTGTEAEDEKFIELPAGTYTVSELDNLNYDSTKTKVQVGNGESNTATFTTVTISGDETVVTFTNTPKSDPGITDGSGVINSFQKDGNVITITGTPVKYEDGSKDDTVVTDKTTTSGE